MKTISWTRKALKQLNRITHKDRVKVSLAVDNLASFPAVQNTKALINHKYPYRLRVGNYRVFFSDDVTIILIEEVRKRDERTY